METFKVEYIGSLDEADPLNDNIDVYVQVGGKKYFAIFFTIDNIITIMDSYKRSGECLNGKYFWSTDMCIVERIDKETIESSIEDMLKSGKFYSVFDMING